jgi:hypothetical protein
MDENVLGCKGTRKLLGGGIREWSESQEPWVGLIEHCKNICFRPECNGKLLEYSEQGENIA